MVSVTVSQMPDSPRMMPNGTHDANQQRTPMRSLIARRRRGNALRGALFGSGANQ